MSKFHINKHGVPAPCKASKGKCPLGGDSGSENHFNTQEEAQVAADKINAKNHGYLPVENQEKTTIQMDEEIFNTMFSDDYNNRGFQYTGPTNFDFEAMKNSKGEIEGDSVMKRVYDSLPENFRQPVKDGEYWVLVKKDNMQSHMRHHIVAPSEFGDKANEGYESMVAEVRKHTPEHIEINETGWYGKKEIDNELSEKISKFATDESIKESTLIINGQEFFVDTPKERDRNWAKEYFESGHHNANNDVGNSNIPDFYLNNDDTFDRFGDYISDMGAENFGHASFDGLDRQEKFDVWSDGFSKQDYLDAYNDSYLEKDFDDLSGRIMNYGIGKGLFKSKEEFESKIAKSGKKKIFEEFNEFLFNEEMFKNI